MANSTKSCTKCGESKSLDAYSKNRQRKDGHESQCKACRSAAFAAWRLLNMDKRREDQKAWYAANPGAKAQHDRDYRANHLEEERAHHASWYAANREASIAAATAWVRANPDKLKAARDQPHRKATKSASDRAYRRAHLAETAAVTLAWKLANRDRVRVLTSRRKALKRDAPGHSTIAQVAARVAYYGGKCWMCGAAWQGIDHVKPLSKGGSNWPSNLRPACTSCNSSKKATWESPGVTVPALVKLNLAA
ncbi:HNH endonuclease [Cryobacterium arcticum]|uniref:HNH nuclease domain-containing protein n=1 Tax=Cryobacterium arcticum TaxID=670052 RepID=A0A1B1BPU6_9MICO|nr:HNH endonuclease [Cryobacterium arcticum]ANP74531.1 hypothetical protein PA27867_3613 [Cryobacterium arcticum]